MTLVEKFHAANEKVNQIEANGGLFLMGYETRTTPEYDEALKESQDLYDQLAEQGIDPFA